MESDHSGAGSAEYVNREDNMDVEEDEVGVKDRREVCDVCRKSMNATASL